MTTGALIAQLNQCQNRTIVVVGDVMLDEYHWCKVTRLSPEAPVPICSVESTTLVPGGAANVANNLIHLGATVTLVGVIGSKQINGYTGPFMAVDACACHFGLS